MQRLNDAVMVYVVTSGTYSDYEIRRIFSTREMAEEYAHTLKIEEWEVDAAFDPSTDVYWYIVMNDRQTWAAERQETPPGPDNGLFNSPLNTVTRSLDQWRTWVRAPNETHAIKIGAELITEAKYNQSFAERVATFTGGVRR
jgi:alpha-L-arabinofuranosidase